MQQINIVIGSVLKKEREERNISQENLAFDAGLHRTYISQIERGLKNVTVKVLYDITTALNMDFVEFIIKVNNGINEL